MTISEAVKLYREFKGIDEKTFGMDVFLKEEQIKKIEEDAESPEVTVDELLKLFQFFSLTIGDKDPREVRIKTEISKMLTSEIRRRAGE